MLTLRDRLRASLHHIGVALREPEAFAWKWHQGEYAYPWWVFAALGATAVTGTTLYGLTMGMLGGSVGRMFECGLCCTLAAGIGWSLPLPALYVLNSLSGSRLGASTTLLAAQVTTSWGGLAMLASIPLSIFFTLAVPDPTVVFIVHVVIFTGVGVAMIDVFGRVMKKLEPDRGRSPAIWLALVGAIGSELFYAFGLFQFTPSA